MTLKEMMIQIETFFPGSFKNQQQLDAWTERFRRQLGHREGLALFNAFEHTMANWTKAGFPKPHEVAANLDVRIGEKPSDGATAKIRMRGFCSYEDLLDWQQRGWITRKEMIGHQYFEPDRFFGKPSSARELRMNWEEIPFTHLSDAEAEKCLPYYEQTLAENYTDVAAGILRIMIGNRAKNMRGVPA